VKSPYSPQLEGVADADDETEVELLLDDTDEGVEELE
jgi:hypothetical protein